MNALTKALRGQFTRQSLGRYQQRRQALRVGAMTQSRRSYANSNEQSKSTHFRLESQRQEKDKLAMELHPYVLPHPIWSEDETQTVKQTHVDPPQFVDKYAYWSVWLLRTGFDLLSGYYFGSTSEYKWVRRIVFLETVAGVPGMMGAMVRHLQSLRTMKRDHGWIHTLLEEAENERMHLLVALELKQPSWIVRTLVLLTQGIFVNLFFITYLFSPRYCHRFVGYLEEEAVKTYTRLLEDIEHGNMTEWKTKPAPLIARNYWKLPENATMKDTILAIRADEAHHRDVNHTFSQLTGGAPNPFGAGK